MQRELVCFDKRPIVRFLDISWLIFNVMLTFTTATGKIEFNIFNKLGNCMVSVVEPQFYN